MIRLDVKSYNLVLTEKQQKYQHYRVDKDEYLTSEEIESRNRTCQIYIFSFRKSFGKTNKETR